MMFRGIFLILSADMKKARVMSDYWVECLNGERAGL
jgi:hypothetical protein